MTQQLTLLPDLPGLPSGRNGIVYLMTDGLLLKWGYTSRGLRQRSGELRAQIIGFLCGTREDEARYHELMRPWCIGGEWFSVPDDPAVLDSLWLIVYGLGQWKNIPATRAFAHVIAANLRLRPAA
jgi:hypothetical protein